MPELPEVETTRRGLEPHLVGCRLLGAVVREPRLRYPVPDDLHRRVANRRVSAVGRRGKYLTVSLDGGDGGDGGGLLLHLGMSGSLRIVPAGEPPRPHDHVDLRLEDGRLLRLHDPRRFGSVLYTDSPWEMHPLLRRLGPEPLEGEFEGGYLYRRSRGRRGAVKAFLMDSAVVVGVGNIYAAEALFRAGIRPDRPAGRVGEGRYRRLAEAVREVLGEAIAAGGTTLRDFLGSDGNPGYFALALAVYGQERCRRCGGAIRRVRLAQRGTYFCPRCQR